MIKIGIWQTNGYFVDQKNVVVATCCPGLWNGKGHMLEPDIKCHKTVVKLECGQVTSKTLYFGHPLSLGQPVS